MTKQKNKFLVFLLVLMAGISSFLFTLNKKEFLMFNLETEEIRTVDLLMVGDMLVQSNIYDYAYNEITGGYEFNYFFDKVKSTVKSYDLAFCNQESILGGKELVVSEYPYYNSPYEFGDAVINAGFNLISTANNHSFDKGEKGIINSYNYWHKHKNIITSGTQISSDESNVKIFEKNGISFAFVAYTKGINNLTLPLGKNYLVNIIDRDKIKKEINEVRKKVDFVIVSMHWGQDVGFKPNSEPVPWREYEDGTNPEELAKFLAELDVDLVIGHHPHVVHPIERIDNTLVFYSLGNFLSDQNIDEDYNKRIGLMSSVQFTKYMVNDKTTLLDLSNTKNELLFTDDNQNNLVIPFSQIDDTYKIDYLRLEEKYNSIIRQFDANTPITKHKKIQ